MKIFELDNPNSFFTLVVRNEIFQLLELLKKPDWKIYKKQLLHSTLKIKFEYNGQWDCFVDNYFLVVSREEQEAFNYQVGTTYKECEKVMHKMGLEKLKQELRKINENVNCD